jgi:hypothetical protein
MPSSFAKRPDVRAAVTVVARTASVLVLSSLVIACQTTTRSSPDPDVRAPSLAMAAEARADNASDPKRLREDAVKAPARIYIEPSVLRLDATTSVSPSDQARVRWEIDRQLCFKMSRKFDIALAPEPGAGRLRTMILGIEPTSPAGSAATAAASVFIPLPVRYRGGKISGGLTVDSELLAADGQAVAAMAWTRSVKGFSLLEPSLSPVGDALQLAGRFAKAAAESLTPQPGPKRPVGQLDPCARFGPRQTPGRAVGGALLSLGAGLYAPSVSGAGRAPDGAAHIP